MADFTYATLIVAAEQQVAAQELLSPDYFQLGLSADGSAPVTHHVTAGPFSNDELNTALNQTVIQFWANFGNEPNCNGMVPVKTSPEL